MTVLANPIFCSSLSNLVFELRTGVNSITTPNEGCRFSLLDYGPQLVVLTLIIAGSKGNSVEGSHCFGFRQDKRKESKSNLSLLFIMTKEK